MNLLTSQIGWLRIVAFLEGTSFLLLVFVAMPLKYYANMPEMVRYTGMAHGLLFVGYLILAIMVILEKRWDARKATIAMLGSILPFGTFYADWKVFRHES